MADLLDRPLSTLEGFGSFVDPYFGGGTDKDAVDLEAMAGASVCTRIPGFFVAAPPST
ncbi:hypothetical protein SAMN04487983_10778 [Streptomyces sp. yr375]|uniref:hypothetical protein n=1 Tax=Streptomyces sp. yr375 TaxID=1761906 RepID=UPI0008BCB5D4|nr:hypothetical protein [Streptomyces sp. yr375]SES49237.1 hypothetical protein SAMN04487983_10778 [Streptomyces sp. yr375]